MLGQIVLLLIETIETQWKDTSSEPYNDQVDSYLEFRDIKDSTHSYQRCIIEMWNSHNRKTHNKIPKVLKVLVGLW